MHKNSLVGAVLAVLATVEALPQTAKREELGANLPESAHEIEKKFQPYVDYDGDGCYNTAAIDPDGNVNHGHDATGTPEGHCHNPPLLEKSNTYSRRRCNNGYCAVMYEYYFEKDQAVGGSFLGGHKHDWENVVVFAKGDTVVRVAPSCHGGYDNAVSDAPLRDATHPMVVYHKDGGATHCFRIASSDDIDNPENDSGHFYESPLVGWNLWPSLELKNKMLSAFDGGVGPKLDSEFGDTLKNAAGDGVPGFDPYLDA